MSSVGIIKLFLILAALFSGYSASIYECSFEKDGNIPVKLTKCVTEEIVSADKKNVYVIEDGRGGTSYETGICKIYVLCKDRRNTWKLTIKAANQDHNSHALFGRDSTKEKTCEFPGNDDCYKMYDS